MNSRIKFGIVVFPGSNCDHDAYHVAKHIMNQDARFIWHKEGSVGDVDVVILPGGFSYGDYLRCGAIARFSPVMKDLVRFAREGGTVIGICNGFQVLCEIGLLPGVLLRNQSLKFECRVVRLRVENAFTRFTSKYSLGNVLSIPIAHGDGNYFAEPDVIKQLLDHQRIIFRYCDAGGEITPESNPNGSMLNIAGIINERGNVLGMMPHPERASEELLGMNDGRKVFESIIESVTNQCSTIVERVG